MSRAKHEEFGHKIQEMANTADTEKQKSTSYIRSERFDKDVELKLAGYNVRINLQQLLQELFEMPIEDFSSEIVNKIKILLRGYQISPEFDQFNKTKLLVSDKITLLNIIQQEISSEEVRGK